MILVMVFPEMVLEYQPSSLLDGIFPIQFIFLPNISSIVAGSLMIGTLALSRRETITPETSM
jgi:hypothetical protein